uniref:Uncharacterized protein n=1 Tax=Rhizophora mucronata TaxID=61149 RepID=A0A2P2M8J7_RHIMU
MLLHFFRRTRIVHITNINRAGINLLLFSLRRRRARRIFKKRTQIYNYFPQLNSKFTLLGLIFGILGQSPSPSRP